MNRSELLAPAGDLDAAYAAFHYGADAIYLGLKRFSARAGATNFDPDELGEILAYAHAAAPRRAVYVALNTLLRDEEIDEAIDTLATVAELGADAVIVQDPGLARLVRNYFPEVTLHASTQMAIHNLDGALAAKALGFKRVTLARELTLPEIQTIVNGAGLEVEVFIHGALCYAYSGLCLYSSMLRGRSGNRGECTYPCREAFTTATGKRSFPFSMKDLALPDKVRDLRAAGVMSFKIEGRKKSALYVATTVDYYRKLLDGRITPRDRDEAVASIQTVFSRPWTSLYVASRRNREVIDTEVVGHRGAWIGTVGNVIRRGREDWLCFKTRRRIERHDGLQIDVEGDDRPFGFALERLRHVSPGGRQSDVFEVPAHSDVEVLLPREHPSLAPRARLYCSSSQSVKQQFRFLRPKPGAWRTRTPVTVALTIGAETIMATAECDAGSGTVRVLHELAGEFGPSRHLEPVESGARQAFAKLGDTDFALRELVWKNPEGRFVPVSLLNRLRRDLLARLAEAVDAAHRERVAAIRQAEAAPEIAVTPSSPGWSLKTDRLAHLDGLDAADWAAMEEVVLDIGQGPLPDLIEAATRCAARLGRERVRLALPGLARAWEMDDLADKVSALVQAGWQRWEAGALFAWPLLERCGWRRGSDPEGGLTADWPVYVTNREAARQVLELGAARLTLSPENGLPAVTTLAREFGPRITVVVYQDTPLFVSENCAMASLGRRCVSGGCSRSAEDLVSDSGEHVVALQRNCRTVVIGRSPQNWSTSVDALSRAGVGHLRADFMYRCYTPSEVRDTWRALRAGRASVPAVRKQKEPEL